MLRICELTVSFGEKRVLDSFSLTLPGEGITALADRVVHLEGPPLRLREL